MQVFVPPVPSCRECLLKLYDGHTISVPALVVDKNALLRESMENENLTNNSLPSIEIDLSEFPLALEKNVLLILRLQWTHVDSPLNFIEKDRHSVELIRNIDTKSPVALGEYMSILKGVSTIDELMALSHLADYMYADKMVEFCFLKMNLILLNGPPFSLPFKHQPDEDVANAQKLLKNL